MTAPLARSRIPLALVLVGLLPACARAPEERYWLRSPPPPARVEFLPAWERPLPFCPTAVRAGTGGFELRDGDQLLVLDELTGEPRKSSSPASADPPDRGFHLPWNDRVLTLYGPAGRLVAARKEASRALWTVEFGTAVVAPLQLYRGRLVVQALDNYVYGLQAWNGHEAWRTRLSHRLIHAGAFWQDHFLTIPAGSPSLAAVDLHDGSESGSWTLQEDGDRFVSGPAIVGDRVAAVAAPWGAQHCRAVGLEIRLEKTE